MTWFPVQLFELDNSTPPFHKLAVKVDTVPPAGVATAKTTDPRCTLSGLLFVAWNCKAGTCVAPGICVEGGGTPATVDTVSTGGVEVGVGLAVLVAVLLTVLVAVKVVVEVGVAVLVALLVTVSVAVNVAVTVAVFVAVFVTVSVAVKVVVRVAVFVTVFVVVSVGV